MYQTDATLPIEMTNKTGTHFLDLNVHCLLEIFSSSCLTLMDLGSLADTCKHFKQITQRLFPKEIQITSDKSFIRWHTCQYYHHYRDYCTLYRQQDCEIILKNFGSRLVSLKLDETNEFVVNLVAKYCGDVTLRLLEIDGMKSIENLKVPLGSIFQRLRVLSIILCDPRTYRHLKCDSLTELKIVDTTVPTTFLDGNLFFFRHLRFDLVWSKNDNDTVSCSRIVNLFDLFSDRSKLVEAIGKEVEGLKDTKKCNSSLVVLNQPSLPKLRRLEVVLTFENYNQIIELLQASPLLEKVALLFMAIDPFPIFYALSKRENLRELTFMSFFNCYRFPWKMLPQLRILYLGAPRRVYAIDVLYLKSQMPCLEELLITS
ncbi:uncharacterized protein LOC119079848 [Bradysia coprophila]|uniref:uncharacterized protein LOC119079848 n=1 Tax=Bradysia coprophila TaxID=38358 RepID=UPI00187D7B9B|nr:uncharacterized protein LOC119079848 [Bradysia coprophila]